MAVKIRLARHGKKASPFYHIVVADSRSPRDGKFIEKIGTYKPTDNPASVSLNFERALHWLQVGAQPTDTTRTLLQQEGVLYKKHLLGGIAKGAFDAATGEQRFQAWLEQKRAKDAATATKKATASAKDKAQRLDAEKKVSETRAAKIVEKRNAAAAAASAPAEEAAAE